MNLDAVFKLLEGFTSVVAIGGLALAFYTFTQERARSRQQRRDQVFDELDQRYVEFMRLCVDHPDVDVLELPMPEPHEPTPTQLRKEYALLAILISLFESAEVMYRDQDSDVRKAQYEGWKTLMKSYAHRPAFRRVWNSIGPQFDTGFQKCMNGYISKSSMAVETCRSEDV
jgi:hypothetical protein